MSNNIGREIEMFEEDCTMENRQIIKMRPVLIFLSFISLFFRIANYILFFYTSSAKTSYIPSFYTSFANFSSYTLSDYLSYFIRLLPCVLLILYLLKFYKSRNSVIFLSSIFEIMAIMPIIDLIIEIDFSQLEFYFRLYFLDFLIIELPIFILFTLAAISILKGFSKKIFLYIAIIYVLCLNFGYIYIFFQEFSKHLEYENLAMIFYNFSNIVGIYAFYVALLLFVIKNRICERK